AHLYETLHAAGEIVDAGYKAIDSLRLEKRYLYWGADIGPDQTPYEAGLGFAVALGKDEFIGRAALTRLKADRPRGQLSVFVIDDDLALHGSEAILHDGKVVGVTTSAGFGHTVGKWIAYGYVPSELAKAQGFEIEAFTRRLPARRIDGAPYDAERRK